MPKRVLVTGGAGFIGSHLVDHLIEKGFEVTILDDLSGGLLKNVNRNARFIQGSITDKDLVEEVMRDQEIVYHLAAYAAEGLSHFIRNYNYNNNLIGSVNLINASIKNKIKCFLFTSSMAVYGSGDPPFDETHKPSPEDPYGIAKYAVEQDLKVAHEMFGLNYVIIRPHNVYGERQFLGDPYRNVIGIFMNRIMQGKSPLIYGDGLQTRAFSYFSDIVPCIAQAPFIEKAQNEIINLGASKAHNLNELTSEVLKAMGANIKPQYTPPRHEVKHAFCTTDKSERILDYKDKTPLSIGLQKMAEWAKMNGTMDPIIWEGYELTDKLPDFWKNLDKEFPNSSMRINASLIANPKKFEKEFLTPRIDLRAIYENKSLED
ncbi:MAG: NAD-dependent epimerase/dehydratase family protein [Nanoarchaeota archaeon]|nr:NAD-dependent epimerase/dehydratase family protein [Nanoarchaeota archaeon]